jgi:hypothetical protein
MTQSFDLCFQNLLILFIPILQSFYVFFVFLNEICFIHFYLQGLLELFDVLIFCLEKFIILIFVFLGDFKLFILIS